MVVQVLVRSMSMWSCGLQDLRATSSYCNPILIYRISIIALLGTTGTYSLGPNFWSHFIDDSYSSQVRTYVGTTV